MMSLIWEVKFIMQQQLYYATTLTPNEGSSAMKSFRNHNFVLNQDKTIHHMWESLSPLGLHSPGSVCFGFLYHTEQVPLAPSRNSNLSGQRDPYGGSSSSWGTLGQPMVQWPEKKIKSLSNLPDLKPIDIELSQQKPQIPLWPLPVRNQCTEYLSSALLQAVTALAHIWASKLHEFICLPLPSSPRHFFPPFVGVAIGPARILWHVADDDTIHGWYLSGWQSPAAEHQHWPLAGQTLLVLLCQGKAVAPDRLSQPRLMCCCEHLCSQTLSVKFCEQVCCHQCLYARDKLKKNPENTSTLQILSFLQKWVIPLQSNRSLKETPGLWFPG